METVTTAGQRTGVLLTNLGTPDAPTPPALRRYLAEFLSDPRVIERPRWLWYPILYGVILNIRPRRAAGAYAKVWTEQGSPLYSISVQQAGKLRERLQSENNDILVELAMRYGNPSIESGLEKLAEQGASNIIVLPLYPQYSATTTASTYDAVAQAIRKWRNVPSLQLLGSYQKHPAYIKALANSVHMHRQQNGCGEKLMMSFHGLPKRYIDAGDPYQHQCEETAELVAAELGLTENEWAYTFQSRFGPEEWLQPYTDKTLQAWGQAGIESVDVICPGFSADCLETLEEIAMENKDVFLEAGGKQFSYIPCLNDHDEHIEMMAQLVLGN